MSDTAHDPCFAFAGNRIAETCQQREIAVATEVVLHTCRGTAEILMLCTLLPAFFRRFGSSMKPHCTWPRQCCAKAMAACERGVAAPIDSTSCTPCKLAPSEHTSPKEQQTYPVSLDSFASCMNYTCMHHFSRTEGCTRRLLEHSGEVPRASLKEGFLATESQLGLRLCPEYAASPPQSCAPSSFWRWRLPRSLLQHQSVVQSACT